MNPATPVSGTRLPYPEFPKTYNISLPISESKGFAIISHKQTNHLYDGYLPYEFHLGMTVSNAHRFKHLISHNWFDIVEAGCWLHDTVEDTRTTYSSIKEHFGEDVADIVYAVSNEKGRNRKERENDKYYEGIRNTPYATFVKLCDRMANIQYSKMTAWKSDSKLKMYEKEHTNFKERLYDEKYKEMFDYIHEQLFTK